MRRNGFDIRASEQKYTLKNLPGSFTALQMISYMYVGFKKISPEIDSGFDLSKEYGAALAMFNSKGNNIFYI